MRLINVIDSVAEWPMFAIAISENSPRKWVRVGGVLLYAITFLPLVGVWFVVAGLLCIPAMIQDA